VSEIFLADKTPLFFEAIEGKKDLPTLIFLHEGLGCVKMWKQFPRELCNLLECPGIVYDRQGYGQSAAFSKPRTTDYLHEYALIELPAIISQLLPSQQPFYLIGHSDGGSIALIYASTRPACLKGIITEAAHVFVEPVSLTGIHEAIAAFKQGKLKALEQYHGEKTETLFYAWAHNWLSEPFRPWNIENLCSPIACPALIIQGTNDQYGTAIQVSKITDQVKRSESLLIKDCGHTPHAEQKTQVLAAMADFIRKTTRESSG
jgi:pimeloyl-ACP methyl ester carboxylesterase